MTERRIHKGDKVRDAITGAEGIVVAYTEHLTNCDTALIEMGMTPEGKAPMLNLDVTRLEIVEAGAMSRDKLPEWAEALQNNQPMPAAG